MRSATWNTKGDFSRRYGRERGDNCHVCFINPNLNCIIQSVKLVGSVNGSLNIFCDSTLDEQARTLFLTTLDSHELPTNDRGILFNNRGMQVSYISPDFRKTTDELFRKIMAFITQLEPSFDAVRSQIIQLVDQYANAPEMWTAPRSLREGENLGAAASSTIHINVGTIGRGGYGFGEDRGFGFIAREPQDILLHHRATNISAEDFVIIDANRYQSAGIDRNAAVSLASANATISRLMHSFFQNHGIVIAPTKNDFDKAWEFYNESQFENALTCMSKFKREELDSNPYSFGHGKAASVSKSLDAYRLIANCYRHLHRYSDALNMLEQLRNKHHNVLSSASMEQVAKTAQEWEKEAQAYANTTSQVVAMNA